MAVLFQVSDTVDVNVAGEVRRAEVTEIEKTDVDDELFVRRITIQYANGLFQEFVDDTYTFDFLTKVV